MRDAGTMRDPVALAWSGRVEEARAVALEQAGGDDPFLVRQGLEALAVLGAQHGVRADERADALLRAAAGRGGAEARSALQAAAALGSRAVEEPVAQALEEGQGTWEGLRYAGELPSLRLGRALAAGWRALPASLRDEALLVSCVVPAADKAEAEAWGARVQPSARDPSEEVRAAAMRALEVWRPPDAADVLSEALEDEAPAVRRAAAQALAAVDRKLLTRRAKALGERCPEAQAFLPPAKKPPARRRPAR